MTKVSYGERRQYALGDALDSVMNYPLRDALVAFLTGRSTARTLADLLLSQRLNYPQPLYYALMNLTASHDVARTRSALALDFDPRSRTRAELAALEITDAMAAHGAQLQVLAAAVQFWLPGIPSIYYGDEAGMQGLCDPFNRAPLQMCDTQMLQWYAQLTTLRHAHPALTRGEVAVFAPAGRRAVHPARYRRRAGRLRRGGRGRGAAADRQPRSTPGTLPRRAHLPRRGPVRRDAARLRAQRV